MKLQHEGYQPNMVRFLAEAENRCNQRQFCEFLIRSQKADPDGFRVMAMENHEESFSFVVANHSMSRGKNRSFWTAERVQQEAARILENPLVCAAVRSNPVCWNEDTNKAEAYEADEITGTLVVDERTHSCWVFLSGFNYVLLMTMLVLVDDKDRYRVRPHTDVIRLNEDGSIEYDASRIKEVHFFDPERNDAYARKCRVMRA